MEKTRIKIAEKEYNVSLAKTEEQRESGLQNITELPEDSGMLFLFDSPDEVSMWMEDTKIPLDIIFINEDLEVIAVYQGVPLSRDLMTEQNVSMVLEVNINSGINVGDELEFSPNMSKKMRVLKEDGTTQMELEGGERIFSRVNTKILVKFAKKAYATKSNKDYKALGKRVFKFLDIQESNEPEYVDE